MRALRRRLKPELRLFYDIANTASAFGRLDNKIRLTWGLDELPLSVTTLDAYVRRAQQLRTRASDRAT